MSLVALRFYDSAIPTPSLCRARSSLFFWEGRDDSSSAQACKRAALFCTIVSSAHNPPLIIFSPVAQHLPARAVREARDALVEAVCFGTPANEQGPEAQEFAVRGSDVPLVGAVLTDAGQDFLAFDEVLVVADVAVNVTMIFIQNLFDRQLALAPIRRRTGPEQRNENLSKT